MFYYDQLTENWTYSDTDESLDDFCKKSNYESKPTEYTLIPIEGLCWFADLSLNYRNDSISCVAYDEDTNGLRLHWHTGSPEQRITIQIPYWQSVNQNRDNCKVSISSTRRNFTSGPIQWTVRGTTFIQENNDTTVDFTWNIDEVFPEGLHYIQLDIVAANTHTFNCSIQNLKTCKWKKVNCQLIDWDVTNAHPFSPYAITYGERFETNKTPEVKWCQILDGGINKEQYYGTIIPQEKANIPPIGFFQKGLHYIYNQDIDDWEIDLVAKDIQDHDRWMFKSYPSKYEHPIADNWRIYRVKQSDLWEKKSFMWKIRQWVYTP